MAAEYLAIREALAGILDELNGRSFDGNRRLAELRDKLEGRHFHLVVMGQFKRGKSTLINALLGAEILPTAIVPLTSIVTRIGYGEAPAAFVHSLDRRREEIRRDWIQRIEETTRKFQKSLDEKADLTLSTIREALQRAVALKDRSETEVSATLSHLDERLLFIERIRGRLARYRALAEAL